MGYLGYYAAWVLLSYGLRQPWLLAGVLGFYLLRRFIPTPGAVFGGAGKVGRLRRQVELNRANVTARRDLATVYLNLLRPQRAFDLLEEGLALSPGDAELTYLSAVALHKLKRHEEALARLLTAIEKDARLRQGHPYFVAGETLLALRRFDDAADAFERYLDFNSSDVAAHTLLARAYAGSKNPSEAKRWLAAGLKTWYALPGAHKRKQFGAYCGAQWAKITVLQEPLAIAVGLGFVACLGLLLRAGYPVVAQLWQPNPDSELLSDYQHALAACGKFQTGDFEGRYVIRTDDAAEDAPRPEVSILRDRIIIGAGEGAQELCLVGVLEQKPGELHARVLDNRQARSWGAGASAPYRKASSLVDLRLSKGQTFTRMSLAPPSDPTRRVIVDLIPQG